ncbi:MAG TPA: DUF2339 domain-containing protein, partial [Dongiaceae bacterium]|nr:DUF2339 domain-containing protein [Dongiaceae bacterium]
MEIFLGLLALGLLVGVPTAAFVALARTGRLASIGAEVNALRHRLEDLERQLAAQRQRPDTGAGQVEEPSAERPAEGVAEAPVVPVAPAPVPAEELPPIGLIAAATAAEPPHAPVDTLAVEVAAATPVVLEERIGSRIFVWVGGVALALAGAFLVKYSIDAGLLGPGVRVLLGLLLGLLLLGAGEFMRTRSARIGQALSAAGLACLYASLFAAVSLYGLVDRSVAFALLAAVTAGTISLSLRQGPFVGLIGLAGGFLTPLIVGSDEPNAGVLFTYLFLLQLGTQVLMRRRGWWWLAAISVAGGMLWVLVWLGATQFAAPPESQRIWPLLFLAGSALLASWSLRRPSGGEPELLYTALGTQAAALCLTAAMVAFSDYAGLEWLFFAGLSAFVLLLARLRPEVEPLVALAAGLGVLILGGWPEPAESGLDAAFLSRFLTMAATLGALFAFGGFIGLWGAKHKLRWAIFSAAGSAAYFLVAYLRLRHLGGLPPWGYISLALAALHLGAAERVARYRTSNDEYRQALGVFALAVTGFVALAVPLELEQAWMAVAWSLQLVAIAWIERRLDIPWLR